jgi:putative PIN family toxin of toxin-antitoxin system
MARVVLDTNVLVSALIDDGKARKLVLALLDKHTVTLSAELVDLVSRDKFKVTNSGKSFSFKIVRMPTMAPDKVNFKVVLEDPDDEVVLNTAHTGRTHFVVTLEISIHLTLNQYK